METPATYCNACDEKHPAALVFDCDDCQRNDVCEDHCCGGYTHEDYQMDRGMSEGK